MWTYHAALSGRINPLCQDRSCHTANCKFLRGESEFAAMWYVLIQSQRGGHAPDLFWNTKWRKYSARKYELYFEFRQAKVAQLFTTQDAKEKDLSLSSQHCYRILEILSLISRWCFQYSNAVTNDLLFFFFFLVITKFKLHISRTDSVQYSNIFCYILLNYFLLTPEISNISLIYQWVLIRTKTDVRNKWRRNVFLNFNSILIV